MNNQYYLLFIILALISFSVGCASQRPVLYPNEQLNKVGPSVAKQDVNECMKLAADAGLVTRPGRDVTRETAIGAATGAAVGAATGAVTGSAGRGAAIGGASGAAGGFMWGLFNGEKIDPTQKRYVEECLRDKGYNIVGWQ